MEQQQPKYPVRVAAKLSGVPPATLRAWEKRYGVPTPTRTASGYRLYSELDLAVVRWIAARVRQGVPPRQAARLASERRAAGISFDDRPLLEPAALIADLKAAFLAYDEDAALRVLRSAATILRPHEIFRQVVLPAVADVGSDWEAGRVSVAQEHFASGLARRYVLNLLSLYDAHGRDAPVVCACAPGEYHELGLLAVALELTRRGRPVVVLGQDTPVDAVLTAVDRVKARTVVVAAVVPESLRPWLDARETVARLVTQARLQFVWGGPGALAADALPGRIGVTIDDAVAAVLTADGRSRLSARRS